MEHSAKGFAAIVQLLSDPVHDPVTKSAAAAEWQRPVCCSHQPVQKQRAEIVCPKPVRPARSPCLVDSGPPGYCMPRSSTTLAFQRQAAAELDLLDFLLAQDGDFESELDDGGRFYFGTPPARTGNPIVKDAEFRKQSVVAVPTAVTAASPVKYQPYPTAMPTRRSERGNNGSYGPSPSPLTTVPNTRIVGFSSAGSDPHPPRRFVSALA